MGAVSYGNHTGALEVVAGDSQAEGGEMTTVRKALLPALILFLVIFFPLYARAGEYQVSRVIDGDTIEVKKGEIKLTVRLVGIDVPEVSHKKHDPGQPYKSAVPQAPGRSGAEQDR
jgi:hypothetical protein